VLACLVARFPSLSAAGAAVPASIFARLRDRLARFSGDVIPLQIGDTHLSPPARLDQIAWREHDASDLYAYGAPGGWAPLVDAIATRARDRRGIPATVGGVQIACGATHALACAVQALCDPGDELVLIAPHWPLIRGIAVGRGVVPIEEPHAEHARLEAAITPRTCAIYFATPNNPDGAMLARDQLAEIARVADRHDLWILADEVYDEYCYDATHVSIAALGAHARTVTVGSFAKTYAQAGMRVGYAVASEPTAAAIRKLVNHTVYNVPVAMQRAAFAALSSGDAFLETARTRYRDARDRAAARLHVPVELPPGGAYLWLDFSRWTGGDCMPMLERIAEAGVLIAPGSAFGEHHAGFARLCFTGVAEQRLDEGIARINGVVDAWR
jgi:aspartate/methionine/tyrosine aminotransferase